MATADGGIAPRPSNAKTEGPKTLGVLNIIFGVLLILIGFCTVGFLTAGPAVLGGMEKVAKDAVAKAEAGRKQREKEYDDRIAEAKTDDEKKQIEAEKASATAGQPQVNFDFSMYTGMFKEPTMMKVSYAGALTGLALHIALLVSGIGLVRLTPWGRSLALWWAGLQIVQVLALLAATIIVVLPIQRANTDRMLDEVQAQLNAKAKAPTVDPSMINFIRSMSSIQAPIAVCQSLVGCVYPVVLLFLLNTSDARAACRPKKPKGGPDDGFGSIIE